MNISFIDHILVVTYLLVTLFSGLKASKAVRGIKDFSSPHKKFPTSVLVMTLMATAIGGENIFSLAERVYEAGIIYMVVCSAIFIEMAIIAIWIAPRIKLFKNVISVGDIMECFYGKTGKIATGFCGFLLSIGFVGAQVAAIGYLTNYFYDVPPVLGVIIGAGIVIIYSALGGIQSVTYTDAIQFIILAVSIPLLSTISLELCHGFTNLIDNVPQTHISLMPHDKSIWHYILLFIILCVPTLDPAFTQRILMSRDVRQVRKVFFTMGVFGVLFFIVVGTIGLTAWTVAPGIEPNDIIRYFIKILIPSGLKGFLMVGLLAVVMSTADSYLNAGSVAFAHDIVKPILGNRIDDYQEMLIARGVTVIMGIGSIVAALTKESIMDIVLMFCGFWAPVIVVPLIGGLFGYRTTVRGFVISAVTGITVSILWMIFLEDIVGFEGLVPSMLINALLLMLIDRNKALKPLQKSEESLTKQATYANIKQ